MGGCGAFRHNLIALFAREDTPDRAAGFMDIALVAGDEVDMGMGQGLASGVMDFKHHIESVGTKLALEDGFSSIKMTRTNIT